MKATNEKVSGDSESIDGHQIYAFDSYETFMQIGIDQDGDVAGTAEHDERFCHRVVWTDRHSAMRLFLGVTAVIAIAISSIVVGCIVAAAAHIWTGKIERDQ